MNNTLSLEVQLRDTIGKKVKYLRQDGLLPATVYGKGFDAVSIQVDERTFNNLYRQVGHSKLIELFIPGHTKQTVFVHDVQRHPVSRSIIHADFRVVDLRVAMSAEVPITLVGSSVIVDRGDAVVNNALTHIEVYALPADLPPHIEVDISELDSLDKAIYVRDLPRSDRYEITTSAEELIVSLTQTRMAAATEEESVTPSEPEKITRPQAEE